MCNVDFNLNITMCVNDVADINSSGENLSFILTLDHTYNLV